MTLCKTKIQIWIAYIHPLSLLMYGVDLVLWKGMLQECAARVGCQSVLLECAARVGCQSGLRELAARVGYQKLPAAAEDNVICPLITRTILYSGLAIEAESCVSRE